MKIMITLFLTFTFCFFWPSSLNAKSARLKVIDFDDEVVEGMNKRPLDSLNQFSDGNPNHRRPHLYRKRVGFRSETERTLEELRYMP